MKKLIKYFLLNLGYTIHRSKPSDSYLDYLKIYFEIKTIFDVGAHHGETAIELSNFFPKSRIFSFEPFKDSFEKLNHNVRKLNNVIPINYGLSNQSKLMDFYVNDGSPTNSMLSLSNNAKNTWNNSQLNQKEKIKCNFISLDDYMSQNSISNIDLLKIDVQGSEYLVLEGAKKSFYESKIKAVFMEIIIGETYVDQKSLSYYLNLMNEIGFELIGFYDLTKNTNSELIQLDALFLNKDFKIHNKK